MRLLTETNLDRRMQLLPTSDRPMRVSVDLNVQIGGACQTGQVDRHHGSSAPQQVVDPVEGHRVGDVPARLAEEVLGRR